MKALVLFLSLLSTTSRVELSSLEPPLVSAERYIQYKREQGHLQQFRGPSVVLICFQKTSLHHLQRKHPLQVHPEFDHLYLTEEGDVGVLGGWGIGAPALANKIEQLGALGVKEFIAVGTAGSLQSDIAIGSVVLAQRALAEDGVAHLYLDGHSETWPDQNLTRRWCQYQAYLEGPDLRPVSSWSFSCMFRETASDLRRVQSQGCEVVEMETATLYAISLTRGIPALSLFVISDLISPQGWQPQIKEPHVRTRLHQLCEQAFAFAQAEARDLPHHQESEARTLNR